MSNLDNSLFESVCALLGIDKKAVEEYLKDLMSNMTCDVVKDVVKESPVETPVIDHGDLPNHMNPGGKSDNQLKAEGWELVENFEKRDDGAYICKRIWTKPEGRKCECNCQEGQPDISDARLKSDLLTVDGWMDVMNWALLHNWSTMKIAMEEKFLDNKDEVESVLKFINLALEGTTDQVPVTSIWNGLSSKNAYACAEVLDHIIRDIIESIEVNETNIVTDMNKLCPEARNMLISRLTKYKSLLDNEMDMIIDYTDSIEPQYHHMNIMTPYVESSPYTMILLWVSLITEYLGELIEITNKILSANKVL